MRIYGNIGELDQLVGAHGVSLNEQQLKKATVSALNKTLTSVRAFAVKEIAEEYNVNQAQVRDKLKLDPARYHEMAFACRMEASLYGGGSPGIPLYSFAPTPKRIPSTRRLKSGGYSPKIGIKVMVHRGSRKTVKDAFIARMDSGHVGVFRRKESGKSKREIKELYGPSPIRMLDSPELYQKMDDFVAETMEKNMAHEAEFYLK